LTDDPVSGQVRRGDVRALASEIVDDFNLDPEGGILAVVVSSEGEATRLTELLRTALPHASVQLQGGPLAELNSKRDELVLRHAINLVRIPSLDDLDELLVAAPDLNDWIESVHIVEAERSAGEPDLGHIAQYLAKLGEACAQIDLTGLVPGFTQQWRLPLDSVYMELARDELPDAPQPRLQIYVGHPGTGKTTALRHRVVELARRALAAMPKGIPDKIPILVPAAAYAKAMTRRIRPFAEFLSEELAAFGFSGGAALLRDAVKGPRVCVCVDALDEVPADQLKSVVEGVVGFADATQAYVLITSRPAHLVAVTRLLQSFTRVLLREPDHGQIDRFIQNFLEAHADTTGSRRALAHAEGLKARLRQPDLARLTTTPLTLTFLVLLHVVEGRLPERRVSLYHRLSELLVERWNIARSLAGPRDSLPFGEALRIFAPLAWWMLQQRPSGYIGEADLVRQMTNQLVERGEEVDAAVRLTREFLERMRRDMLILLPTEQGEWYFFHPTVAEYLAGVELSRNHKLRKSIILRKALFSPPLREMLLFCAGELGIIRADDESLRDLLRAVLAQSTRAGRYDSRYASLLVGLLVEDVGMARAEEVALIRRLVAFACDYYYSYYERMTVDADVIRAIQLANSRNRSTWQEALRPRFVATVDAKAVDMLLRHAATLGDQHVDSPFRRAPLLTHLPELLKLLELSPLPLLMHLVSRSDPLSKAMGWFAAAMCSEPTYEDLLKRAAAPTGNTFIERLAIKWYNIVRDATTEPEN
jgi:hypothetical protein